VAKGKERHRLLAALNRDSLDALIFHRDEASEMPGGAEIINDMINSRARIGQTSREKRLHDLIEDNDFKAFFTEFNAMHETDELRFLKSVADMDLAKIRNNIGAAAGIADQDRINYLLERATKTESTSLYIDASEHTYHWQPMYKVEKKQVSGFFYPIPEDLSRLIYFSHSFGNAPDIEININTISDATLEEDEAEKQFQKAKPGPGGFLWPAERNRSTLPNLWKVKQAVHEQMKILFFDEVLKAGIFVVQYLMNVVFPTVHGSAIRALRALKRASLSTRWMMGSQVVKGRLPPALKILGGQSTDTVILHRYTNATGTVRARSFWTEWSTTSVRSASRMTGVPEELVTHRLTVRVNRSVVDKFFRDAGTKFVPGEGAALEYKNTVPIDVEFVEVTPLRSP
jgi:predicted DNA binding CopG/RHH family protein